MHELEAQLIDYLEAQLSKQRNINKLMRERLAQWTLEENWEEHP